MTAVGRRLITPQTVEGEGSDVPDVVFVAVLGLLAIVGFRTVYGGWSWLSAGGAGLVAGIALGVVGRRRRFDVLLVAVATAAIYFVLSGVAISQNAVGRVVPTPATLRGAATGAVSAWAELLTAVPPVGRLGNLGVVPLMCGLVGAVLATSAALRTTGIVRPLLPLLGVLVITILFGTEEPASLLLQGAGFAGVSIAWVAYRRRGTRLSASSTVGVGRIVGAVLMVVLAAAVAPLVGDHLPGAGTHERFILRDRSEPPFDPHQHPSPLAGFARYKSDDPKEGGERDRTLFEVSGLPEGVPLRIAVMDTYDGVVWKVAGGNDSPSSSGVFQRVGESVPPADNADLPPQERTARVQISVEDYDEIWLPVIGSVSGIQFGGPRADALAEALRFNRTTNSGAVPTRFSRGDRIVIDAKWAVYPDQAATTQPYAGKAGGVAAVGEAERIAEGLAELAERILASGPAASSTPPTPGASNPDGEAPAPVGPGFDSVHRIAEEFVVAPGYGYSDGRDGDQPSISGHSQRRMNTFADESLQKGLTFGNDEQYASALALISRTLHVPSRVVMGFCRKGCPDGKVTGADVSAWVEVNLDGVGWVPLNATPSPDKDLAPAVPQPKPKPKNATQPPPPPVTVPPAKDVETETVKPKKSDDQDDESVLANLPLGLIAGIGTPILLVGGTVAVILLLKSRRRRRRREAGSRLDRVIGGWQELDDRALDLGRPLPTRATRREIANYLGSDAARRSAHTADAAIFGPTLPDDAEIDEFWLSVDAAYDELAGEESALRRLRAGLNPASLIRQVRPRSQPGVPADRIRPRRNGERVLDGAADRERVDA